MFGFSSQKDVSGPSLGREGISQPFKETFYGSEPRYSHMSIISRRKIEGHWLLALALALALLNVSGVALSLEADY